MSDALKMIQIKLNAADGPTYLFFEVCVNCNAWMFTMCYICDDVTINKNVSKLFCLHECQRSVS